MRDDVFSLKSLGLGLRFHDCAFDIHHLDHSFASSLRIDGRVHSQSQMTIACSPMPPMDSYVINTNISNRQRGDTATQTRLLHRTRGRRFISNICFYMRRIMI